MGDSRSVKRVAAGIVRHEGKVLVARRLASDAQGGLWEFPGGKLEADEAEEACLHRELEEELGMRVEIERLFMRHSFSHERGVLELVCFLCKMLSPPSKLEAHSEIAWAAGEELRSFDWMQADVAILERLLAEGEV